MPDLAEPLVKRMAFELTHLRDILISRFDEIIDVRSPGEFADDHVPGAVNLPVLDDAERALVGTIYKQESAFRARKIGASLVAQRAGRNIAASLIEKPGSYQPLVYCWRGGMRSGAFATILQQIGWRAEVLQGGYKAYRRAVVGLLYAMPGTSPPLLPRLVVLEGNTGTAKTEILHLLAARGAQILDLEGLASHRGSLFGAMADDQPAQRAFDSRIAARIALFDPSQPVFVEAESSRIGHLGLPAVVWAEMRSAPRIALRAPSSLRGDYLAKAYVDIADDRERLKRTIDLLAPYHPAGRIADWQTLVQEGKMAELARQLVTHHYDPKYARQRARDTQPQLGVLDLPGLNPEDLDSAASRILALAHQAEAIVT